MSGLIRRESVIGEMKKREKMTNCPNCGAPISGDSCQYCGTVIWDFATIELQKPQWIKVKHDGEIIFVRAMIDNVSTHISAPANCFYEDSALIYTEPSMDMDVHLTIMPDEDGIYGKIKEL